MSDVAERDRLRSLMQEKPLHKKVLCYVINDLIV